MSGSTPLQVQSPTRDRRSGDFARLGAIVLAAAALWIPLAVFLALPERQLLGERGHFAVAASAMIQAVSIAVGMTATAIGFGDDDHRARRWSTTWGWLAVPAGVMVAWLFVISAIDPGDGEDRYLARQVFLVALIVVAAVPAAISPRRHRLLAVVSTSLIVAAMAGALLVEVTHVSVAVIGPVTAYCVAVALKSMAASHAGRINRGGRF